MNRAAAFLAFACGLAYAAAGVSFFFDPSNAAPAGSAEYWRVLSTQAPARQAFLLSFALAATFALGLVQPLRQTAALDSAAGRWLATLAMLGYAVSAVSYFRLLGAEARRAAAYSAGDAAVQQAIASFSLVLDPQGWLGFAATGAFIVVVNGALWRQRIWPRWHCGLGVAVGLAYLTAWLGLLTGQGTLVKIAAAVGAIVLGPLWWFAAGWRWAR